MPPTCNPHESPYTVLGCYESPYPCHHIDKFLTQMFSLLRHWEQQTSRIYPKYHEQPIEILVIDVHEFQFLTLNGQFRINH